MIGIDLSTLAQQATPSIIEQIDKSLADITMADGESKGIVIVPDGKGSYYLVKTVFDSEAHNHMVNKGHEKVDELIKTIINSITK